jgi:hypothetical protein
VVIGSAQGFWLVLGYGLWGQVGQHGGLSVLGGAGLSGSPMSISPRMKKLSRPVHSSAVSGRAYVWIRLARSVQTE